MKSQEVTEKQFEEALGGLIGQACSGFAAGPGTGSVVNLDIGKKVPKTPDLTDERQEYDSEYALFIHCTWRVDSRTEIVCGAWDDNSEEGPMIKGLQQLVGETVDSIRLSTPALDLEIAFSNQLVLRIFCDVINMVDMEDNYSLFLPNVIYTVGTRSDLKQEPRT